MVATADTEVAETKIEEKEVTRYENGPGDRKPIGLMMKMMAEELASNKPEGSNDLCDSEGAQDKKASER